MIVRGPTIDGSSYQGEGFPLLTHTVTMRYLVSGVTGDPRTRHHTAENASGIPAYREFFPGLADEFVFVVRKRTRALDSQTFEVLVDYERPESSAPDRDDDGDAVERQARLTTSGFTYEVDTNKDRDGTIILTTYTPPNSEVPIVQAGTVRVRKRGVRMVFSRTERKQPTEFINEWTNTVNVDQVGRYAPGELYMEAIDSSSSDGQQSFEVDYNVLYQKGGGFDPSVFYVDARSGSPPRDLVEGLGIIDVRSYFSRPFSKLKLPWPD